MPLSCNQDLLQSHVARFFLKTSKGYLSSANFRRLFKGGIELNKYSNHQYENINSPFLFPYISIEVLERSR